MLLDFYFSLKEKDVALSKAKAIFYNEMYTQLDTILSAAEDYLYIDKLEIDLGEITEENISEKFSIVFTEALQKLSYQAKNQQKTSSGVLIIENKDLSVDDVIFFLQHGYWQWNIQNKNEKEILKLLNKFLLNRQLMFLLFDKIRADHTIVLKRVTSVFTQDKSAGKPLFYAVIDFHFYLKTIESFIESIFQKVIAGNENFYEAFIHKLYKSERLTTFTGFKKFVTEFLKEHVSKISKISAARHAVINKLNKFLNTDSDNVKEILPLFENILSAKNIFLTGAEIKADLNTITFFKDAEKEKISINNAGLVLLHPYLPFLFKELKLVNESKNFIDVAAQQKAILFLQFLINNKRNHPEHLLVLNKILCGYPVHMPVKIKHQFNADELKAGEEMLDALIEHWTVLKNTSPKGLIESFIKRKGLIQKNGNDFVVQVEKISIDILLDSLPFGIRTIKMPWNEYIIYTEWSY